MNVGNLKKAALVGGIVDGGFSVVRGKPAKEVLRESAIGATAATAGSVVGELVRQKKGGLARRLAAASTSILVRHGLRSLTGEEEEEE